MKISHVVAVSENNVIGKDGGMPWHIPGEQKIFKRLTVGKALILGRKTHESIGRVLPDRTTIIVTRQKNYVVPGAHVVSSVDQALQLAKQLNLNDVVIGGGGELFKETLPLTDTVYLTLVHAKFEGDTFYSLELKDFEVVKKEEIEASIPYAFIEYKRRK